MTASLPPTRNTKRNVQVEHHARRLAAPLLRRAGERVRLHKEAPETLRFGFRRASKGYGVRVSRQCAVSSGVAAAWAAVPAGPAAAAATTTTGSGPKRAEGAGRVTGTEAAEARSDTAVAEQVVSVGAEVSPSANPPRDEQEHQHEGRRQQQQQQNGEAAEEALSEVVRLVMSMFDKMVYPGEKLDLTLLSVGLAGFRDLGGTAQSGMAR